MHYFYSLILVINKSVFIIFYFNVFPHFGEIYSSHSIDGYNYIRFLIKYCLK